MNRFAWACGILLSLAHVSLAAPAAPIKLTPEEAKAIETLVIRLGDVSFRVREKACADLLKFGRRALPALSAGVTGTDPEVRQRCQRLLPEINRLELAAKLQAFIDDKDGKLEHDLSGWKRFLKIAGNDAQTRSLFAEMYRAESELLEQAESDPQSVGKRFAGIVQGLQRQLYQRGDPPYEKLSVLMFLASDTRLPSAPQGWNPIASVFYQNAFRQAIARAESGPAFRKLFVAYVESDLTANAFNQAVYTGIQCQIKELLPLAIKIFGDKRVPIQTRGQAVLLFQKIAAKEQYELLLPVLEENTSLGRANWNNIAITTELRDVALGNLIAMTGQSHRDYGFDILANNPTFTQNAIYHGFSDQAKRDAALKKWSAWYAANKPKK